ncbi:hypothetical protein [Arthrobacter sp. UM1]|uniref:hypothetical protein n=1 Tax=Arthrobacter sp. UM1 TaxID=2766776 RepID=UPI001CF67F7B|nr:hypothetical protein [Arthrobacter sp. UM1]MCB4208623.1 hypothetical protein [Arthrobacter sp. UM1]
MTNSLEVGSIIGGRYKVTGLITSTSDGDDVLSGLDQVLNRNVSILVASKRNASQASQSGRELATGERHSPIQVLDMVITDGRPALVTNRARADELLELLVSQDAPYVEPFFTESLGSEIFGQKREATPQEDEEWDEHYYDVESERPLIDLSSMSERARARAAERAVARDAAAAQKAEAARAKETEQSRAREAENARSREAESAREAERPRVDQTEDRRSAGRGYDDERPAHRDADLSSAAPAAAKRPSVRPLGPEDGSFTDPDATRSHPVARPERDSHEPSRVEDAASTRSGAQERGRPGAAAMAGTAGLAGAGAAAASAGRGGRTGREDRFEQDGRRDRRAEAERRRPVAEDEAGRRGRGSYAEDGGEDKRGRFFSRALVGVLLAALLLGAVFLAVTQLSTLFSKNGDTSAKDSGTSASQSASPSQSAKPGPKPQISEIQRLVPSNPTLDAGSDGTLGRIIDGNKQSSWGSLVYTNPQFGNLTQNFALVFKLKDPASVKSFNLSQQYGSGGAFQVYVNSQPSLEGATQVGQGGFTSDQVKVNLKDNQKSQYVIMNVTELPRLNGVQAQYPWGMVISEVTLD